MQIVEYDLEKPNRLVKCNSYDYPDIAFDNPNSIFEMFNKVFRLEFRAEEFVFAIGLTTKCGLLGIFNVSHGTVRAALVSVREIMMRLLLCGASGCVVVHNHPSGDVTASVDDQKTAKDSKAASDLLGIQLFDFIILSDTRYLSFKEHYQTW